MHAQLTRELRERHGSQFGFILLMAGKAARQCHCGRLGCTACGFVNFHQRLRKIEHAQKKIQFGYLTGGKSNPSML